MKNKRAVILIMAGSNPYYRDIENTIRETWFNLRNDEVEILFYSDNEEVTETDLYGDTIMVPCRDGLNTLGFKTLCAFEWVSKNYKFDYIYRSNLGAMVYPENIFNFLKDKPSEGFYCGIIGKDTYHLGIEVEFASGSGYFLSKDLVEKILERSHLWPHNAVDDVAMGYMMNLLDIRINECAIRKNICNGIIEYQVGRESVDHISDDMIYHIRLRSDDREIDKKNMIELYKKYLNEND